MQTILITVIEHNKPLPAAITDVNASQVYTYLHAQGNPADVRTSLVPQKKEAWEKQGE